MLLPLDAVRLTKYTNPSNFCSDKVDYSKKCIDNFECTINTLNELYIDGKCGRPYSSNKKYNETHNALAGLVSYFKGEYAKYDLFNDGFMLDLTID